MPSFLHHRWPAARRGRWTCAALAMFAWALALAARPLPASEPDDEVVQMVIDLLGDQDKDLRAVGLEQVRSELPGAAATRRIAEQLPRLSTEARIGLLSALADRGDSAARPMVLPLLGSPDEAVVVAAVSALGSLATPPDVPRLVELLAHPAEKVAAAARASLTRFGGDAGPPALVESLDSASASVRVELIEILTARRAKVTVPTLLREALVDAVAGDRAAAAAVRGAAMKALAELADGEHLPGMVGGVLKAERGPERDAAERAVAAVCARAGSQDPGALLLPVIDERPAAEQTQLLTLLGRVGGPSALRVIETAIASPAGPPHDLGLRAICNWPDASIAPRLIELATSDAHPEHRREALAALIRVAPLPDKRPPREKLALLEQAMQMCSRDEERLQVLKRVRAVRIVESLRYLVPYLDQPRFAQMACESIVELAHHREVREPNKAEFHAALDRVKAKTQDPIVVDRANRYQNNQTWTRPAAKAD